MVPKSLDPLGGYYPIVGIQEGLDCDKANPLRKVPQRMELDDWFTSDKLIHINQRSLFFPAFNAFCGAPPEEKFSFFQIAGTLAGIHGKPYVSWDEPEEGGGESYCTHGEARFATWHRPYLLLFEQIIYEYMKDYAVNNFTGDDLQDLLKAADEWRLPYWDWAAKKPDPTDKEKPWDYNIPQAFEETNKKVEIRISSGSRKADNGLYRFKMPEDMTMGDEKLLPKTLRITSYNGSNEDGNFTTPFGEVKSTSRHPEGVGLTKDFIDGVQNNSKLVWTLRNFRYPSPDTVKTGVMNEGIRDAYYRLFPIAKFQDFASTEFTGKKNVYANCEALHNNMHRWCGGPSAPKDGDTVSQLGHMSVVAVAAFDPLFWFHHCNMDRTIAIWQAIHEGKDDWFNLDDAGEKEAAEAPLRPFHKDTQGSYWDSNDARNITSLGYTYPILDKQPYIADSVYDRQAHLNAIKSELTDKYNAARNAAEKSVISADPGDTDGIPLMSMKAMIAAAPDRDGVLGGTFDDYAVNVAYEKMALGGRQFTVHIFVGKVPSTLPYDFQDPEGSLVGQVVNFTSLATEAGGGGQGCTKCTQQAVDRTQATGRVVLTNGLITRWKQQLVHTPRPSTSSSGGSPPPAVLASMSPVDVVHFLEANLHWRVTTDDDGLLVDDLDAVLPSLKVSLVAGKAQHFPDPAELSRFWDYRPAYQVTAGRPGGAKREDSLYPAGEEWQAEA
ncbi:common central domain of tyrosinase-domain-containing protein [Lasiosphaeria ovina]|uniref:tyrosinase n=1 Tax=Lasiosphaeria ovina TaxID=92902 RepID=A0AAE0MYQ7_9PEZI|nr:common central domain of tyrosinase-domain-containing protein [Lasiosphaeria ovina]